MENPSTTSAREHDDSAMIDAIETAPGQQGGSGGNLAGDVSSQAELDLIEDPDGRTRVHKADDIANNAAEPKDRPRGA
ncbi:hypothetical protein ACCC88_09585 [Sphingomonas sp. Sphisp140]|uniref:hypothetical protein n=1 Tax=unclassified Sphingomonas TaxID=196159 RepID=UPI0039AEDBF5